MLDNNDQLGIFYHDVEQSDVFDNMMVDSVDIDDKLLANLFFEDKKTFSNTGNDCKMTVLDLSVNVV